MSGTSGWLDNLKFRASWGKLGNNSIGNYDWQSTYGTTKYSFGGEILNGIGEETLTDGGGHNAAAGMTGTGDAEAMLHICMQRTMDEFRRIKKSMYPAE